MEDRGEVYVKWEQMWTHMFVENLLPRNLYLHLYLSAMNFMSITKKCGKLETKRCVLSYGVESCSRVSNEQSYIISEVRKQCDDRV